MTEDHLPTQISRHLGRDRGWEETAGRKKGKGRNASHLGFEKSSKELKVEKSGSLQVPLCLLYPLEPQYALLQALTWCQGPPQKLQQRQVVRTWEDDVGMWRWTG